MKFNTLIFQQQKPYLKLLLVSDGQMFGCRGDNLWSHIYELLITVFLSLLVAWSSQLLQLDTQLNGSFRQAKALAFEKVC